MKKVFVIGSNSFSGSDFIDYLLERGDYEVYAASRSAEKSEVFLPYRLKKQFVPFFQIDLNIDLDKLFSIIGRIKPEYIVNFAAQSEVAPSWENPDHWFQTNAVAITNLANRLKNLPYLEKYVHISSPEVYGSCEGIVTESSPVNPSTPYAASKAAGDLSLLTFHKNFSFPLVFIRATNVYGPAQQLFKIIPRTILQIKSGGKIYLHGGGKAIKSYIYIRDVSHGEHLAMVNGKPGNIYHLAPKEGVSVRSVVEMICKKMGVSSEDYIEIAPERLGQDRAYVIDATKANKELNWMQATSIQEGIERTIDWFEKNYEELKAVPKEYIHKK